MPRSRPCSSSSDGAPQPDPMPMTAPTPLPQTVHDAFGATAARTPDAPFLCVEAVTAATYGIPAGETSWRDAARQVDALRRRYAAAGYGHGHRVGLMLENQPVCLFHWFAL